MNAAIEPDPLAETHGKYTKVQNLGQGSFGFVQLGKAGNGDLAAIKVRQKKLPFHRALAPISDSASAPSTAVS